MPNSRANASNISILQQEIKTVSGLILASACDAYFIINYYVFNGEEHSWKSRLR